MNGASLLSLGIVCFVAGYFLYSGYLQRLFGVDPSRKTPAHTMRDGVDYVPARLPVLFGHHFASIAGAGPIVGPVLGAYLGWGPVALWIILGCIFVGAMHDFAALFVSVRNGGRSIGHVIEEQVGWGGRQIFLLFSWAALVLVVAIFTILVAKTFVETPAVATASILFMILAPVFGFLVYRRNVSVLRASLICVPLVFLFVPLGMAFPLDLARTFHINPVSAITVWSLALFAYVMVASTIPVWVLLQPRDYLNSYFLYAMLAMGVIGIFLSRPTLEMPAFSGLGGQMPTGGYASIFPILFVTVACGACSGFHALVASGTTAKQIDREEHIRPIGYGAMLVEGVVALVALISVAVLSQSEYAAALGPEGPGAVATYASGIGRFVSTLGFPAKTATTFGALAISAFMLTTLDTATRLGRFAWQELFLARKGKTELGKSRIASVVGNRFVATSIVVGCSAALALSGAGMLIWPVFGASNQLLAALTLLVITLVLVRKKSNYFISLFPMLFMAVLSAWALWQLLFSNIGKSRPLAATSAFLLCAATILAVLSIRSLVSARKSRF